MHFDRWLVVFFFGSYCCVCDYKYRVFTVSSKYIISIVFGAFALWCLKDVAESYCLRVLLQLKILCDSTWIMYLLFCYRYRNKFSWENIRLVVQFSEILRKYIIFPYFIFQFVKNCITINTEILNRHLLFYAISLSDIGHAFTINNFYL